MLSARFASQNLLDAVSRPLRSRLPAKTKNQRVIPLIFLVGMLLWITSAYNLVSAQQAKIAIVLPSATSQVSESDVQYARSVSKRLNQMLNSIEFIADTLEEASLSKAQLKSCRLIILPLNSRRTYICIQMCIYIYACVSI